MAPKEVPEDDQENGQSRVAGGKRRSPEDVHDAERKHRLSVMRVELLATVLSMFMQDGPFLAVRLYTMITFEVVTYSLVFFTAKNVLVLLLLVYKIFLLLGKICCPKRQPDHEDDHENVDQKGPGYDVDDYDVDYDDVNVRKIPPKKQTNGPVLDAEPGDLRNRKEGNGRFLDGEAGNKRKRKKDKDSRQEPADTGIPMPSVGDLQKVIDGPATPAKSMERTKKYDKYMVEEETSKGAEEDDVGKEDSAELPNNDSDKDRKGDAPKTRIADTVSELPDQSSGLKLSDEELKEVMADLDKISHDSGHPEPTAIDSKLQHDQRGREFPSRPTAEHSSSPPTDRGTPRPFQAAGNAAEEKGRVNVAGGVGGGGSAGGQGAEGARSDPAEPAKFVSLVSIKM